MCAAQFAISFVPLAGLLHEHCSPWRQQTPDLGRDWDRQTFTTSLDVLNRHWAVVFRRQVGSALTRATRVRVPEAECKLVRVSLSTVP